MTTYIRKKHWMFKLPFKVYDIHYDSQVNVAIFKKKETLSFYRKQDCSYQGEALNVPTAFKVYGAAVIT